jgi:hypothetical protein
MTHSLAARLLALCAGLAIVATAASANAKKRRQQDSDAAAVQRAKAPSKRERGVNLYPAGPVYHSNEYLGDDPDPFIRSQLMRDLGAHYGGPE